MNLDFKKLPKQDKIWLFQSPKCDSEGTAFLLSELSDADTTVCGENQDTPISLLTIWCWFVCYALPRDTWTHTPWYRFGKEYIYVRWKCIEKDMQKIIRIKATKSMWQLVRSRDPFSEFLWSFLDRGGLHSTSGCLKICNSNNNVPSLSLNLTHFHPSRSPS